jgi:8-oxo-dGTP pyrophosphatase MutT (NUDIX family)
MSRTTRYQGAVIRNDRMLLIKHHEYATGHGYWVIPGGGREDGETEEECVIREVKEETHLNVRVEQLLLDEPGHPGGVYQRLKLGGSTCVTRRRGVKRSLLIHSRTRCCNGYERHWATAWPNLHNQKIKEVWERK